MATLKQKWYWPDLASKEVVWNTNCDILEEYCRQFGTCNCHFKTICVLPDGREVNIGQWLDYQRKYKKGTLGNGLAMDRELRLQALVDMGKLRWETKDMRDWDFMFDVLVDYGRRNGTCNVPAAWKEVLPNGDEVNIGQWVRTQRQKRDLTMTAEHRERLQELVDKGLFKWRCVSAIGSPPPSLKNMRL